VSDLAFWPRLLLAVLATWRVTHLVAREDGPGDVLVRLRQRLGQGAIGRLMDCFYCLSLWVALPLALVVTGWPPAITMAWLAFVAVTWLAVSGAACLLERATEQPLVLQAGTGEGGEVGEGAEAGVDGESVRPPGAREGE
jgi:Protein of unknown function (DUF1360)